MRGSLKLFTLFGIPVHLHWSFGLIFLYATWIGYSNQMGMMGTIWLMGFFVALFGCVLLHEYGHSLTAKRYGVNTQDIILTPIGGIARLERMPEKPAQELLVAIAGPMVNVVIAILLLGLSKLIFRGDSWEMFQWFLDQQFSFSAGESSDVIEETGIEPTGLLFYMPVLLATNIALVLFNLIPAFPMDGGRVLRALLAMRLGRVRATRVAAIVGQVIAVLFVAFGLWNGAFTLALIGVFVFTTARAENNMVRLDEVFKKARVRDIVRPNFTHLYSNDWMQTPINLLQQGLERHFLVFDLNERLVGALEEEDILQAARKNDLSTPIEQYMTKDVAVVEIGDSLAQAYYLLKQNKSILAVRDGDTLVGVLDESGLQNYMRLKMPDHRGLEPFP
jgi:Zn-dependent protease/predicted transcriptional regulator